jgi:SAM-dependent methyltransferase
MPRTPAAPDRFDAAYYARHYGGSRRAHGAREVAHLAAGVSHLAAWLAVPVESVLDVGAGPGLWRDWFRRHRPRVRYRSVDASPYACERYGHEQRDIARWRARGRFDLVICQGVLPYLADGEVGRALENLGGMCRGLLYLEAVTRRDLAEVVDRERTDLEVHARPAAFYRALLDPWFRQVGAGLWAARSAGLAFYELEAAGG